MRKYVVEAILGLVLALLVFVALAIAIEDVPFIYQGF